LVFTASSLLVVFLQMRSFLEFGSVESENDAITDRATNEVITTLWAGAGVLLVTVLRLL
jgi:hypothetical protein